MMLIADLLVQRELLVQKHPKIRLRQSLEFPSRPLQHWPEPLRQPVCPNCRRTKIVLVPQVQLQEVLNCPSPVVRRRRHPMSRQWPPVLQQLLLVSIDPNCRRKASRQADLPNLVLLPVALQPWLHPKNRWQCCRLWPVQAVLPGLRPKNLLRQPVLRPNWHWLEAFPILVRWFDLPWPMAHSSHHCQIDLKSAGLDSAMSPNWLERLRPKSHQHFELLVPRHHRVESPRSRIAPVDHPANFDLVVQPPRRMDLPRLHQPVVDPNQIHRHQGWCPSAPVYLPTSRHYQDLREVPDQCRCQRAVHRQPVVAADFLSQPNYWQAVHLAASSLDQVEPVRASL